MPAERGMLWRMIMLVVLSGCLLPTALWGGDATNDVPSPQNFVLTVHEQRLSLRAQDASLTAILAQIGRALGVEVVMHLPADETITVAFDQLPLDDALKQLSPNYAYVVRYSQGGQTHYQNHRPRQGRSHAPELLDATSIAVPRASGHF